MPENENDLINDPLAPSPEGGGEGDPKKPTVRPERTGPETIFVDPSRERGTLTPEDVQPVIDFASQEAGLYSNLSRSGTLDKMVSSSGRVRGSRDYVKSLLDQDQEYAEANGVAWNRGVAFRKTMGGLYVDTMARIGKDTSRINQDTHAFQVYVTSPAGESELNDALTVLYWNEKYQGDVPREVRRNLPKPLGLGRLDREKYTGFTDSEYENAPTWVKTVYNAAVAGQTFVDGVVPFVDAEDFGLAPVPGVAPIGEGVGAVASWLVPFGAANKVLKTTKFFAKGGKLAIAGVNIPRAALQIELSSIAADLATTQAGDETFANFLADLPEESVFNNWLTTAAETDIDDGVAMRKLKVASEGIGLGLTMIALGRVVKGVKKVTTTGPSGFPPLAEAAEDTAEQIARKADIQAKIIDGSFKVSDLTDEEMVTFLKNMMSEDDVDTLGAGFQMPGFLRGGKKETIPTASDLKAHIATTDVQISNLTEGVATDASAERLAALTAERSQAQEVLDLTVRKDELVADIQSGLVRREQVIDAHVAIDPLDTARNVKELRELNASADTLVSNLRTKDITFEQFEQGMKDLTSNRHKLLVDRRMTARRTALQRKLDTKELTPAQFKKENLLLDVERTDALRSYEVAVESSDLWTRTVNAEARFAEQEITKEQLSKELSALEVELARVDHHPALRGYLDDFATMTEVGGVSRIESNQTDQLAFLDTALRLYTRDPGTVSRARLEASYDIINQIRLRPQGEDARNIVSRVLFSRERVAELTPRTSETIVDKLRTGDMSEVEAKEFTRNRQRSNSASVSDIKNFIKAEKKALGKGSAKLPSIGRVHHAVVNTAVDMRTNNILYSMGLPQLAAAGGVMMKATHTVEELVGRGVLGITRRVTPGAAEKLPDIHMKAHAKTTVDGFFYTLSGGTVQTTGRGVTPKDGRDLLLGLFNASAPSRLDPGIAVKSELLLGAGLSPGLDLTDAARAVKVDAAGLSRLGRVAQSVKNDALREWVVAPLVAAFEFIPRKGLGTLDETLKTSTLINEFNNKIGVHLDKLRDDDTLNAVLSNMLEGKFPEGEDVWVHLRNAISESMLAGIGKQTDALDMGDAILENLRASYLEPRARDPRGAKRLGELMGSREELLGTQYRPLLTESDRNVLGTLNTTANQQSAVSALVNHIEPAVRQSVEDAQQYARTVTVTQDVPAAIEQYVQAMQSSNTTRAISPFTRSIVNISTMAIDRTPLAPIMLKKNRQAWSGQLGEVERARAIGKLVTGLSLITIGAAMSSGDDPRLKIIDHGTWKEFVYVSKKGKEEFESDLNAAAIRWYSNNTEIVNRELERLGQEQTAGNAARYLIDNLPDYESGEGETRLNFSRLGPLNMLVEAGMALHDHAVDTNWDYMSEQDEDSLPAMEFVSQVAGFIGEQGIFDPLEDFVKIFSDPDYSAEAYLTGWYGGLTSPFRGVLATAGEFGQQDFRPSQHEADKFEVQRFNQILSEKKPYDFMKRRDWLGRVIDAPDRVAFLIGKKESLDLINAEMEELHIKKRVPKPDSIPKYPGMNLARFTLRENLTDEQRSLHNAAVPATDGLNAYEDYIIMLGSTNISGAGSAIKEYQRYFKSSEYRALKGQVMTLADSDTVNVEAAEQAYSLVKKQINQIYSAATKQAGVNMFTLGDMYVNERGETLKEVFERNQDIVRQAQQQVDEQFAERKAGLEALGGNK